MRETFRNRGICASTVLGVQCLSLGLVSFVADVIPRPAWPWAYGILAVPWVVLTARTAAMRIVVLPAGIRSHGPTRTRFVAWRNVRTVRIEPPLQKKTIFGEYAYLVADTDRRRWWRAASGTVKLDGYYGRVDRAGKPPIEEVAEHLTELRKQIGP